MDAAATRPAGPVLGDEEPPFTWGRASSTLVTSVWAVDRAMTPSCATRRMSAHPRLTLVDLAAADVGPAPA